MTHEKGQTGPVGSTDGSADNAELLKYIARQMQANRDHMMRTKGTENYNPAYSEGANDALEELAVNLGMVAGYGQLLPNTSFGPSASNEKP